MLLDLMLPGRDGIEILQTIRKKDITTPILLLTGRDTIEDRGLDLDSGADDYWRGGFALHQEKSGRRAQQDRL
jgi:two-component system, OmpR family, copper resistance phosphate regulon response regulator CusR